jgi:hypothetical protein
MRLRDAFGIVALAASLAGCGGGDGGASDNAATVARPAQAEPGNTADDANAAQGNVLAAVLDMNDRQRNAVFIRAILDAGLTCQGVKASQRAPDQNGQPLWRADCVGGGSHLIQIAPDGTASIVSRSDR